MTKTVAEGLTGRDAELKRIRKLIEGARSGSSGALALRGEPGVGKTALLEEARAIAGPEVTLLATTGVEGESDIPYAALVTLLAPATDLLDQLPPRQRGALEWALGVGPPAPGDPLTIGTALLGLLDAISEDQPVAVIVDDAQWLDGASAAALLFAARRLGEERIAMLLAIRDGEGSPLDLTGVTELTLGGLNRSAATELLERSGGAQPPVELLERLLAATAGNPLALIELPRALGPDQLSGADPLDEPVAVGRRLRDSFLKRVSALPRAAQDALLLCAASSSERIEPVANAAPAFGSGMAALEDAERAGLIELSADTLRFRHPLVRSAVYHASDKAQRRRAHAALAAAEPTGARRAWHLASAALGPDEEAAEALEAAARDARARGGPGAAASALERAAQLTSAGEDQARRYIGAAKQRLLAGPAHRAHELATAGLEQTADPGLQAAAAQVLSRLELLRGSLDSAHRIGMEAGERLAGVDRERAVGLLLDAALPGAMRGRMDLALAASRRAHEVAGAESMITSVALGAALTVSGEFEEGRERLERWRELADPESMLANPPIFLTLSQALMWVEEYDGALANCTAVAELASERGAAGALQLALSMRSDVQYRLGRWVQARADASESIRLARATGQYVQAAYPLVVLTRLETVLGLTEQAHGHAGQVLALADRGHMGSMRTYLSAVTMLERLSDGKPEAAAELGREVRNRLEAGWMRHPGVIQWRADFIEALVRSSQHEEAASELDAFQAQAERVDRPWVRAAAARCRGLLLQSEEGASAFDDALAWHERGADPFERARTDLAYGEHLRRAGRNVEARPRLRAALDTFEALEAEPWVRCSRAELRAAGGATPPVKQGLSRELTAQELEVAMAVSRGATNREAAATLFLSPKTVEAHLSRVYRKLGIRSRTELAARMAQDPR